jgi:hypothetical protein
VVLVAALLLGAVVAMGTVHGLTGKITDRDELWHLATGRVIVESGSVPSRDPFTDTAGETRWVNTNWLAQVVLFELYRAGGIELDWVLGIALLAGALGLAHARARGRQVSAWAVVPVIFFTARLLRTASTVRPQGWTFVLLALLLILLDRLRERGRPRDALAVAATLALSGQLHGGFAFTFVAAAITVLAELWDAARGSGSVRSAGLMTLAILGGLAGFALHPHGFAALLHPARYALDPAVREIFAVEELRPADWTKPAGQLLELAILGFLGLALVARRAWRTADVLLVLAFAHLAGTSSRGLHYLAIVLAAPLAEAIEGALVAGRERAPPVIRRLVGTLAKLEPAAAIYGRLAPLALALPVAITLAALAPRLAAGKPGDMSSPLLETHADVASVASFLVARDPPGRLFNDMDTGGALIWELSPGRKIFVDGRGDLHALSGTFHDFLAMATLAEGWETILDRYGFDLAVVTVSPPEPLDRALRGRGWRSAYRSGALEVLVRPGSPAAVALFKGG